MKYFIITTLSLLLLSSCQNAPYPKKTSLYQENIYKPLLKKLTIKSHNYDGLHNQYSYQATLLNTELSQSQVKLNALYKQWSEQKTKNEIEKVTKSNNSETRVFLSFYSPKAVLRDLDSSKSPWEIYLSDGKKRYIGRVSKINTNLQDLHSLYSFTNKWSDFYLVTFPTPVKSIEKEPLSLTITGSAGTSVSKF